MQWKKITTSLGNTAYALWSNGRKLLTLAYKNQSDRVYIESEDGEKRYFKCRNKGILKHRFILENEYGTGLGKLMKEGGREYILIDGTRYFLNFNNGSEVEIIAEHTEEPLAVCKLDVETSSPKAKRSLLMIFCYYVIGHPQKPEEEVLAV